MCQKSIYERVCEVCHMRVIISVVTHQVCGGKPPEILTKAAIKRRKNHKVPYRKDGFICKLRIRPHKKYMSYIGPHACMRCILHKRKRVGEEELKTLLADETRTEQEIKLKKDRLMRLRDEVVDTELAEGNCKSPLPKTIELRMKGQLPDELAKSESSIQESIDYLIRTSLAADMQPNEPATSTDSLPTDAGEPSSRAVAKKGKGKEVATAEVEDVPSEATRSSPLPEADRMETQDLVSDVEMEDGAAGEVESERKVVQLHSKPSSPMALFWTWSDRL
ncbi:hypothetical protein FGADI_1593 [Fusarium gaditjirri]|uniref:Uncharacterized protein n=1 Tax=Fusarium gaditjirri TaxID=282569 RepID=A0A8H4TKG5_9HYPO|nr:hypothetical protein FGADI_1593 [Fusarium gaditjirri]